MKKQQKSVRVTVLVLSLLLAVSVAALGAVLLYRSFVQPTASAVVHDNRISSDALLVSLNETQSAAASFSSPNVTGFQTATGLTLNAKQPQDNQPFTVEDLFPGDSESRRFCVTVSHEDTVTVYFHADIRAGYEKLAEVLQCRVTLPDNGDVLYEGLMRDMPDSLNHTLTASAATESTLTYEVTAYLDTGVGNEYQDRSLIADLRWWVDGREALIPPQTGDRALWWLCGAVALCAAALILLAACRRKEASADEAAH